MPFMPIKLMPLSEETQKTLLQGSYSPTRVYSIPFPLSAAPPPEWSDFFDNVWRELKPGQTGMRAQANGSELVLNCPLEQIEAVFPQLKAAVAAANEQYQVVLQKKEDEEAQKQRAVEESRQAEQRAIHETLNRLDYS